MSNTGVVFQKYNRITSEELVGLLVTAILAGFYLSIDDLGYEDTGALVGVENFLLATFAVFLIIGIVILAQKALGSLFGYEIKYCASWVGLVAGFFITFLSYGLIPFFLPGGIDYKLIKTVRLGKFLPSYKFSEMFVIASMVVIIPLFFALAFGGLYTNTELAVFRHVTIAAILISLFALLPLPRVRGVQKWNAHGLTDLKPVKFLRGGTYGYDLFSFHKMTYVVLGLTALVFAGLVVLAQSFSIFLAILLAILILGVYKIAIPYLQKG